MNAFRTFARLIKDEAGVTAIEYAFIASLISIAGVVAISSIGTSVSSSFSAVAANL